MAMPITLGGLQLFTVEEIAEQLDIQETTIRRYLREGKIQGRKLANRWYVPESSLRAYFEASQGLKDEEEAGS